MITLWRERIREDELNRTTAYTYDLVAFIRRLVSGPESDDDYLDRHW